MTDPNIPNNARPSLFFNCGELKPSSFRYDALPTIIYNPPTTGGPRKPPVRPFIPDDEPWVCVCTARDSGNNGGCLNENSRRCIKRNQVTPGTVTSRLFNTKAECEATGFGESPCALSVWECETTRRSCPYITILGSIYGTPIRGSFIDDRECVRRPNRAFRPIGPNIFASLGDCIPNCLDTSNCRYPQTQIPPVTPDVPIGPTEVPSTGVRTKYKCVEIQKFVCENPEGTTVAFTKSCLPCTQQEALRNPTLCKYNTNNCNDECKSTQCGAKCVSTNPLLCPNGTSYYVKKRCVACTTEDPACIPNLRISDCSPNCVDTTCPPITPRPPILTDIPIVVVANQEPRNPTEDDPETRIPSEEPSENETEGDPEILVQVVKPPRQRQGYNCEQLDGRRVCVPCLGNVANCQFDTEIDCLRTCFVDENTFFQVFPVRPPRNPVYIYQSDYDRFLAEAQTTSDLILSESIKLSLPPDSNKKLNNIKIVGDKARYIKTVNLTAPKDVIYQDKFTGDKVLLKSSTLYDEKYNFFNKKPDDITRLKYNDIRTDVFNDVVAEEVYFFLNKYSTNSNNKWNELYYFNLTLEKLSISLRKELSDAFESIHYVDNTLVDNYLFLQVLKGLLISGRLNEFDPEFYIELAVKQSNDQLISIKNPNDKSLAEKIALTLSLNESLPSDESYYSAGNKFRVLRQKRLNTDVGANITVETVSATIALPLEDAGVAIIPLTGVDATDYISIGVGDGYFVDATTETEEVQIPVNTYVSASLMTPASVRYTALKAANIDSASKIIATSLSSNTEFAPSYIECLEGPLYFILDLSSLQFLNEEKLLLNTIKCNYKLITDQNEINNHVINYGFNVVKVPVDFRDPLFTYARDTSSLEYVMPDISLRNLDFYLSGTFDNSFILTRNIPFGLVLVPGCGSKHNPFDSFSEILSRGNQITRTFSIIPTIKLNDYGLLDASLKEIDTVETLKPPKDYYGYSNKLYYSYNTSDYTGTYYFNNEYLSNRPQDITNPVIIIPKIINEVVDPLINMYSPKELKWFDIFSRLNYSEMGSYFEFGNVTLLKNIINEKYNIMVKDVLATDLDKKTGLLITEDYNDSVTNVRNQIILPEDRDAQNN